MDIEPGEITSDSIRVTKENFSEICRSCIINVGEVDIFRAYFDKLSLNEIIFLCFKEKIVYEKGLSTKICSDCLKLLLHSFMFTARFKQSQLYVQDLNEALSDKSHDVFELKDINVEIFTSSQLVNDIIKNENWLHFLDRKDILSQLFRNSPFGWAFESLNPHKSSKNAERAQKGQKVSHSKPKQKEKKDNLIMFEIKDNPPSQGSPEAGHKSKSDLRDDLKRNYENNFLDNDPLCDSDVEKYIPQQTVNLICEKNEGGSEFQERKIIKENTSDPKSTMDKDSVSNNFKNYLFKKYKDLLSDQQQVEVITIVGEGTTNAEIDSNLVLEGDKKTKPKLHCFECLEHFDTMKNLVTHSRKEGHALPPRYKCEVCSKTFNASKGLNAHMKNHGKGHPISVCDICGATVLQANFRRHLLIHENSEPHVCQYCGSSFTQKCTLVSHIRSRHESISPQMLCYICGAAYKKLPDLNRHLNKHTQEELKDCPYRCEVCQKCFMSEASLSLHSSYHLLPRLKGAPRRKFHMKQRRADRKGLQQDNENEDKTDTYLCSICGEVCDNRTLLTSHLNTHSEAELKDLAFRCEECGKYMMSANSLNLHKLRVHCNPGQNSDDKAKPKRYVYKPKKCPLCGKMISYMGYHSHLRMHQGLKPYRCSICFQTFRQQPHLKSHMNIHLGLKPHKCQFCGKKFRHTTSLRTHERAHKGERPFLCPVCGKGFYDSSPMKKHLRTHYKKPMETNVEVVMTTEDSIDT